MYMRVMSLAKAVLTYHSHAQYVVDWSNVKFPYRVCWGLFYVAVCYSTHCVVCFLSVACQWLLQKIGIAFLSLLERSYEVPTYIIWVARDVIGGRSSLTTP